MKVFESILIFLSISTVGIIFFLILCEYLINKLPDNNFIKKWWRNHIVGIEKEN